MTVPNKIYRLKVESTTLLLGVVYSGGSITWHQPEFSVLDISLEPGLDQMVRGEIPYGIGYWSRSIDPDLNHMHVNWGILPNHYNSHNMKQVAAGATSFGTMYLRSWLPAAYPYLNKYQDDLVNNGLFMNMANLDPGDPDMNGEYVYYSGLMWNLKIFFFNPIVNSISRLWAPTAGGVAVVLTGLGFDNNESELDTGGPSRGGWNDRVDEIEFTGLQGQNFNVWKDDFDDEARDPAWTDDPNNGTIIESGDVLTLALGSGVAGDFWNGAKDAPITYITPGQNTITAIAKLNSYTVNDLTRTGIYITSSIAGNAGILFGRMRNDGASKNGLQVMDMGVGELAYVSLTTLPVWLRIRAEGSGGSSVIYFDYSTNGIDWTNLHTLDDESWDKIGLVSANWDVHNAISTPYEFFKYSYDIPSATLSRNNGDFTVDSNTQITIPANKFPALSAGTYHINLKKISVNLETGTTITGYAGDWACDSDGRVFASTRITFFISNTYVDRPFRTRKAPILLSDWHLKARSDGSEIMKYYSMNMIRCPDRVYKGNLSTISSIPRGFDDKTGLFKITDLTLDLANNDLEFSKLLAGTAILKNQIVKLYQAYPDEPFGWRAHIISLIIDDYYFEDNVFKVKLKDITQKYFRVSVPRETCTEEEYPNIHPDSIGAFIPEVLGLCSLTSGEFRGQIEALCIDTTTHKYVAANGSLKEITEVYSDDIVAVDSGDYTVSREGDGRTYITFNASQENKKVTFNAKGYIYGGLNSDNDYVQNPAYILLYFFLIILKIPPTMIDFASFTRTATVFDNMGEAESGKLILQDEQNPMDVAQDLMAEAKCYPRKDGRLALGKKDMSNWGTNEGQTVPVIFRQLDIVGRFSRKYNMRDVINTINAEYDYIPTWDLFKSSESYRGDMWIDPIGPPIPVEDLSTAPTTRRDRGRRRPRRDWAR